MQGFIKQEIGPKGEVAEFHTITQAIVNFSRLPDENGEGGSQSVVRISTFVNKAFYDANNGNADLAIKHRFIAVDLLDIAPIVRQADGTKSVEQHAYEIIQAKDPFFVDAQIVE